MYSPKEITNHNKAQVQAIFDRFHTVEEDKKEIVKSEDGIEPKYWTKENLESFKSDLFKGIDENTISSEDLKKAQEDLSSLKKSEVEIDGKLTEVFIKG